MSKIYDVIVLGAGPAGLAAGLYCRKKPSFRSDHRERTGRRTDCDHRRDRELSGTDRGRRDPDRP